MSQTSIESEADLSENIDGFRSVEETEEDVDNEIREIVSGIADPVNESEDESESAKRPVHQRGRLDLSVIEAMLRDSAFTQPSLKDNAGKLVPAFAKMCIVADPKDWRKLFADIDEDCDDGDNKELNLGGSKSQKKKKQLHGKLSGKPMQKWQIELKKVSWQSIINEVHNNWDGSRPTYSTANNQARSCKRLFRHRYENDVPTIEKCFFGDVLCAYMVKLYYARFGVKSVQERRKVLGERIMMGFECAVEKNSMWKFRLVMSDDWLESYKWALPELSEISEFTAISPDFDTSIVEKTDSDDQPAVLPYIPKGTIPDLIPYDQQIQSCKRKLDQVTAEIKMHEDTVQSLKADKAELNKQIKDLETKKRIQEEDQQISLKCRDMVPADMEFSSTITTILNIAEIILAKCKKSGCKNLDDFKGQLDFQELLQESQNSEFSQHDRGQIPMQNHGSIQETLIGDLNFPTTSRTTEISDEIAILPQDPQDTENSRGIRNVEASTSVKTTKPGPFQKKIILPKKTRAIANDCSEETEILPQDPQDTAKNSEKPLNSPINLQTNAVSSEEIEKLSGNSQKTDSIRNAEASTSVKTNKPGPLQKKLILPKTIRAIDSSEEIEMLSQVPQATGKSSERHGRTKNLRSKEHNSEGVYVLSEFVQETENSQATNSNTQPNVKQKGSGKQVELDPDTSKGQRYRNGEDGSEQIIEKSRDNGESNTSNKSSTLTSLNQPPRAPTKYDLGRPVSVLENALKRSKEEDPRGPSKKKKPQ